MSRTPKALPALLPAEEYSKQTDTFSLERALAARGLTPLAGLDEAGRGPLAGPVVAACVVLPPDCDYQVFRDSKKTTEPEREALFQTLHENRAVFGLGLATPEEIDTLNILQASLLAMKRAVLDCAHSLGRLPACLLVDGKFTVPDLALPQEALVRGESKSASIAAASILAKVSRDRLMQQLHERHPQYNWARNKGYPTQAHRAAIARFGPCPEHRRTFRGVKEFVQVD